MPRSITATAARMALGTMTETAVPAGQLAGIHMDGLRCTT
jgi:hypothetical protein